MTKTTQAIAEPPHEPELAGSRRQLELEHRIGLAFLVALAVLVVSVALAASESYRFAKNEARIEHLHAINEALNATLNTLQDAETGQRGYVITGVPEYLEPYEAAVRHVEGTLENLSKLLAGEGAAAQEDATAIARLAKIRLAKLAETLAVRRKDGFTAAREAILANHGREVMEELRDLIARRAGFNHAALRDEQAASEVRARNIGWGAMGLVLATAAALLIAYRSIRAEVRGRRLLLRRFRHRAVHDELTHLVNRSFFLETLQNSIALAERDVHALGLLFIDMDEFKTVNDRLGHDGGDQVLAEAARRLKGAARKSDVVARLGSDKFAILTPSRAPRDSARLLAERVLAALKRPFSSGVADVTLGASIGIAVFPGDATAGRTLLRSANDAALRAKAAGKSRYAFAEEPAQKPPPEPQTDAPTAKSGSMSEQG